MDTIKPLTRLTEEAIGTVPCIFCRRQFSRYTCPRCNAPYCSLLCFKSEAHSGCSETFYRQELESEVRSDASKTAEERRRIMKLLKRFEEDSMDDIDLDPNAEDEEESQYGADLARRLAGIDLESVSYDHLWEALTLEERDKFLRAIHDPDSELAKQLLSSEGLERQRIEPWWEAPLNAQFEDISPSYGTQKKRVGEQPEILNIPPVMIAPPTAGKTPLLLYNICATIVAYAYITRHLATSPLSDLPATDPEYQEARKLVAQLVPFVTDHKSKVAHLSLSSVVTDIWSRFDPNTMSAPFFALLLKDAAKLLCPSSVTVISQPSDSSGSESISLQDHPSANTLRAISDLASLFTPTKSYTSSARGSHVVHKLTFYAAHVLGVPTILLRALIDELETRARATERRDLDVPRNAGSPRAVTPITLSDGRAERSVAGGRRGKIVELT